MPQRPHILYVLSDEHCGMAMSHAGDPNVRTATMDRMAEEGVSFGRAYANCPLCTPSRGTIFSGRHAHAGPIQSFFDIFKATSPTTATVLRSAGYHTAYFGMWHGGIVRDQRPPDVAEEAATYPRSPFWGQRTPEYHRGGFQDWYGFDLNIAPFHGVYYHKHELAPRPLTGYQTDVVTDLVLDYIAAYERDDPLFLVLSVEPPHFPLEVPEQFARLDPDALITPPHFGDTPQMRRDLAIYYAMIENLDWNLGRLLDALAGLPAFADNTLIAYVSDHGDFMGNHGLIKRKEYPHEESVRVPALFHWPGHIPAQGQRSELFSLVDLLPTTLGLAGVDSPPHVQGTDFSPVLLGQPFSGPKQVLLEMCGNPRWTLDYLDWRGLVTHEWKYAYLETGHEWLFHLATDPYEQHNLSGSHGAQRDEMRRRLLALLAETREPYFDVLIEHGAPLESPVFNVGSGPAEGIAPTWADTIVTPDGV